MVCVIMCWGEVFPSLTLFFFFNDTATTEIYTLSLHDALPISSCSLCCCSGAHIRSLLAHHSERSEEHTSELQSRSDLVCRLLLEKKNCPHTHPPRRAGPDFSGSVWPATTGI